MRSSGASKYPSHKVDLSLHVQDPDVARLQAFMQRLTHTLCVSLHAGATHTRRHLALRLLHAILVTFAGDAWLRAPLSQPNDEMDNHALPDSKSAVDCKSRSHLPQASNDAADADTAKQHEDAKRDATPYRSAMDVSQQMRTGLAADLPRREGRGASKTEEAARARNAAYLPPEQRFDPFCPLLRSPAQVGVCMRC